MTKYNFEVEQFGVSETGIHLLRNRFNYETINFEDILEISIERGRQVNNWLLVLILGITFLAGALAYLVQAVYEYLYGHTVKMFYIEQFVVPIIPIFLGTYMIINALKTGINVRITTRNKSKLLSIDALKKSEKLSDFISFLSTHNLTKSKLTFKDDKLREMSVVPINRQVGL